MAYKISIGIDWQGKLDYQALCEKVQIAEAAGVHSAWVPEGLGAGCVHHFDPVGRQDEAYQSRYGDCEYLLTHPCCAGPTFRHPG